MEAKAQPGFQILRFRGGASRNKNEDKILLLKTLKTFPFASLARLLFPKESYTWPKKILCYRIFCVQKSEM